jgi:hypothetical protein
MNDTTTPRGQLQHAEMKEIAHFPAVSLPYLCRIIFAVSLPCKNRFLEDVLMFSRRNLGVSSSYLFRIFAVSLPQATGPRPQAPGPRPQAPGPWPSPSHPRLEHYTKIEIRVSAPLSVPTCLPAYRPTYLSTCLPAYRPTDLPAYRPTCLPTCLPTSDHATSDHV